MIIIAGLATGAVGLASLMTYGAYKYGYRRAIAKNAKRLRSIEVGLLGRYFYPVIHSNEKVFDKIRIRARSIMPTVEVYWCNSNDNFIRVELIKQSMSDQDKLSVWTLDFSHHLGKDNGEHSANANHMYGWMHKNNACHKSLIDNKEVINAIFHGIISCNILNEYGVNMKEYEELLDVRESYDSYNDYRDDRLNKREAQEHIDKAEEQFLRRYYGEKPYTIKTQDYIDRYTEEFTSDDKKADEKKTIHAIKCALPIRNIKVMQCQR